MVEFKFGILEFLSEVVLIILNVYLVIIFVKEGWELIYYF